MKKILIILCFAIGFSTLNAQVVKSSSEKTVVKRTEKNKQKSQAIGLSNLDTEAVNSLVLKMNLKK